jgi:hypothetical protein|tara:strand:+ start:229 stop:447 length:219 start_codon:yes stop_codon:yes gene_type:complete
MTENLTNIVITPEDMAAVMQADPLMAEKVKSRALVRMLAEAQAEIETLKSQPALATEPVKNGSRPEKERVSA